MKINPNYRYYIVSELISAGTFLTILIYQLRHLLLFKGTILTHDHFYWGYPMFQYFAESLISGHIPLWNPFSHGGEPFYPILLQIRLLEPVTLLTIYVMKWFTNDLVIMYNWTHFNQNIIMIAGVYILLRSVANNIFIRISLLPVLLFFTFMFSSFRQPAVIYQFLWVPYIIYFLFRIIYSRDYRWHNWLFLAGLIGINWQSYYFSGVWIFLLFFTIGNVFFRKNDLEALLYSKTIFIKLAVAALVIAIMMFPNIVLMIEKNQYVFPARSIPVDYNKREPIGGPIQFESNLLSQSKGILMPYSIIEFTGSFAKIWDFIQIICPEGNWAISNRYTWASKWGDSSEIYFYIGMLPWVISIIGFVYGRHKLKKIWLIIVLGYGLLLLGPQGGLHRILYYLFPPLWFVRHTHSFVLFFVLAILYFYVIGLNHLFAISNNMLRYPNNDFTASKQWASVKFLFKVVSIHFWTGFIIFTCSYIFGFYTMTHLKGALTNYIFLIILLMVLIGRALVPTIRKKGIVSGIVVGHLLLILIFHYEFQKDASEFIIKSILLLAVPICLFLFLKSRKGFLVSKYRVPLLMLVFSASLIGDILYHLQITKELYQSFPHPQKIFNFNTSISAPRFIDHRKAFLPSYRIDIQSMRYISLIMREPYAFSPVHTIKKHSIDKNGKIIDAFEAAFFGKRWSSFFLLRTYFNLLHADIPVTVLKEMFAIEEHLFQFKKRGIIIDEKDFVSIFKKLDAKESVRLMKDHVLIFLSDKDASAPDLNQTVFTETPTPLQILLNSTSQQDIQKNFSYTINDYAINTLNMTITSDSQRILYWADGFDKRWHAYIDGKEEPVYRANGNFKAIVLPVGTSEVNFVYKHYSFVIAIMVFWTVFVLCILIGSVTFSLTKTHD